MAIQRLYRRPMIQIPTVIPSDDSTLDFAVYSHYTHTRPYNYNRPVITTTPTIDRATLALSLDQNASSLLQAVHWSFQIQRS